MNYRKHTVNVYFALRNVSQNNVRELHQRLNDIFYGMHIKSSSSKLWTRCEFLHYFSIDPYTIPSIAIFRIYNANKAENISIVKKQIEALKTGFPFITDIAFSVIETK